jgi:hypothetical protein
MTTNQYLQALRRLKLLPHGNETAKVLGLSHRQVQRLAAGSPIPGPVAKLLQMYLKFGVPERDPT